MAPPSPRRYDHLYSAKINNLSFGTTAADLRIKFEKFGRIADCYITKNPVTNRSRGFGFVKYYKRSAAIEAAYHLNGEVIGGRVIQVGLTDRNLRKSLARRVRMSTSTSNSSYCYERKYVTIKIENLAYRTDEKDLKDLFYHCGPIADIYVPRIRNTNLNKGFAFVRFYRKCDAHFAIRSLDKIVLNKRRIRIVEAKYGKPPANRRFAYGSSPMAAKNRKHR